MPPNVTEVDQFWKSVIGVPGSFDPEDPSVRAWRGSVACVATGDRSVDQDRF